VLGVETDFDATGLSGGQTINTNLVRAFFPITSAVTQKMDWIGTTRARVGLVASSNILLYGTAGVAYAGVSDSYFLSNVPRGPLNTFASDRTTLLGWTAGGGLEVGWGQWSVKGEALYYDLGNHTLNASCTLVGGVPCATPNTIFSAHFADRGAIARVGLNYHFNPAGPIAPRY
jgi:outer membrane immunogenic protein